MTHKCGSVVVADSRVVGHQCGDAVPYFVNPDIVPVEKDGEVVDYEVIYNDDFLKQQLDYGKKYRTL